MPYFNWSWFMFNYLIILPQDKKIRNLGKKTSMLSQANLDKVLGL